MQFSFIVKNFQRVACGKTIKELIFDRFKIAFNSGCLIFGAFCPFHIGTIKPKNNVLDFLGVKFLVRLNYG